MRRRGEQNAELQDSAKEANYNLLNSRREFRSEMNRVSTTNRTRSQVHPTYRISANQISVTKFEDN